MTNGNNFELSRRALLKSALSTAVLAGSGVLLAPRALFASSVSPEVGGNLRFCFTSDPANFDPLSNESATLMRLISPCYNGLLRYHPDHPDEIILDLASEWSVSEDGKTYTFQLIEGVKFHDGKPMTSADVKYTFDYSRNPPDGAVSLRKGLLEVVDSIDAPSANTVIFNLKRSSPAFISNIASSWMMILPKHILETKEAMKDVIIGTGPFKLKNYTRGVSYELVKNENYHVTERPYLDSAIGYVIPDTGTTWSYMQTGQIDLIYSIQGQDAGVMTSGDGVVVHEFPTSAVMAIDYNLNDKIVGDPRVRKALSIAIDRNAALAVTANGQGTLGGMMVPGRWALPAEELAKVAGYAPDGMPMIEEAKTLLSEAGFPEGFTVKLLVRKLNLFEPLGVFLKDQWGKIGVKVQLDIQESASYFTTKNKKDYSITVNGSNYGVSDPDIVFGGPDMCGDKSACSGEIAELFSRQSSEVNEENRKAIVADLERALLNNYKYYPLFWRIGFMGMSEKLQGLLPHPSIHQNMRLQDVWLSK